MSKTSVYSITQVSATLDGLPVRGLFDGDDAISVTPGSEVGSLMVGADGSSLFSQHADNSARISLKLQHTSPTHRQLMQKMRRQRLGKPVGFPFSLLDLISNEGGNADKCFIAEAPNNDAGKSATVREWILVTGDWTPTIPT